MWIYHKLLNLKGWGSAVRRLYSKARVTMNTSAYFDLANLQNITSHNLFLNQIDLPVASLH